MVKLLALCLALGIVAGCIPQPPFPMSQSLRQTLEPCPANTCLGGEFSLSPDGRVVAFATRNGICLFDWRTGDLSNIPNPPGDRFGPGSFSPDGRSMVATVGSKRIAIIDTGTLQIGRIFEVSEGYELIGGPPVVQPSTGRILYVAWGSGGNHFRLLDPADGTTRTLMEARNGFYGISTPSFVADDEVIFPAIGPKGPDLLKEVSTYLHDPVADSLIYRYRLGGEPAATLPQIYAQSRQNNPWSLGVTDLLASRDGKTVVWSDVSVSDPNLRSKFNYEIFKLEHGTTMQVTNLRTHMIGLALSRDGSTVAFGSDPSRNIHDTDLVVLELATGTVHQTGLLARLRAQGGCVAH